MAKRREIRKNIAKIYIAIFYPTKIYSHMYKKIETIDYR